MLKYFLNTCLSLKNIDNLLKENKLMKVLTNKIIIETENISKKIQPIFLFYLNDFIDGENWLIFYIMDLDLRSSVAEMFPHK